MQFRRNLDLRLQSAVVRYAWSFQDGKQTRSVTVLELPPVDSSETAVKVAIAAKARELGKAGNR